MVDLKDHEFWLTREVISDRAFLPMTREEFEIVKAARLALVEGLAMEERLALVLENYMEYEATLLHAALDNLMVARTSWSEFVDVIHAVNRRLVNLLSAGRSYIDQVKHFASTYFGKPSDELRHVREWLSEQYDSLLGYRVMEALRNYSQHRGMAVHRLSSPLWWDEKRERSKSAIVPSLVLSRLREDGEFKKAVLAELETQGDNVDLRPLVKEYVSGISIVHGKVRTLLKDILARADSSFHAAIERYKAEGQEDVIGLIAIQVDAEERWVDKVPIFDDLISRRRYLQRRHRIHRNLWAHYVTNEPQ